eukprot:2864871-Rhodomonas_salina.1
MTPDEDHVSSPPRLRYLPMRPLLSSYATILCYHPMIPAYEISLCYQPMASHVAYAISLCYQFMLTAYPIRLYAIIPCSLCYDNMLSDYRSSYLPSLSAKLSATQLLWNFAVLTFCMVIPGPTEEESCATLGQAQEKIRQGTTRPYCATALRYCTMPLYFATTLRFSTVLLQYATGLRCCPTHSLRRPWLPMGLHVGYALSGTDLVYAATRTLTAGRTRRGLMRAGTYAPMRSLCYDPTLFLCLATAMLLRSSYSLPAICFYALPMRCPPMLPRAPALKLFVSSTKADDQEGVQTGSVRQVEGPQQRARAGANLIAIALRIPYACPTQSPALTLRSVRY